jgi:glycosyltransferase involved in cell wall biosynthesis
MTLSSGKPLVTIGIPTHNRYSLLRRCLQNAIAQDYENIEIIVSDNTQELPTPDWLVDMQQAEPRLKYIRQPKNIGLLKNEIFVRNSGHGDYMCVMHDDDVYPTDYISQMMAVLINDQNCVLAGPICERYFENLYWYEYECYSSVGLKQFRRLSDIITLAFENPNTFEHLMYGVHRRNLLPQGFKFGYWLSIILFFYLMSIHGSIHSVPTTTIIKNTTREDIKKYAAAKYVKRFWLLRKLFNRQYEQKITIFYRLLRFTVSSSEIKIYDKIRLINLVIQAFLWKKPKRFAPPTPALR